MGEMSREEATRKVTEIIVDYFSQEQVYLIGSTARGEARPDSDIDFVVVLPDDAPSEMFWGGVHHRLRGIGYGIDVVPFRRSQFDRRSGWVMSLPAIALREGRLLYDASAVAA